MIPDDAVEAAARAIYATEAQPIYDEVKEEFAGHKPWEWLNERSLESYRNKARLALEAAAPHLVRDISERVGKRYAHLHQMRQDELMAKAWEEGRLDGYADAQRGYDAAMNPYEPRNV